MQNMAKQVSCCDEDDQRGEGIYPAVGRNIEDSIGRGDSVSRCLHVGTCADILRGLPDESVDLAYLDPPYNTGRKFKSRVDNAEWRLAYDDKHTWTDETERQYAELVSGKATSGGDAIAMLEMFVKLFGRTSRTSYLTVLMPMLMNVHRVLKRTGVVALQCSVGESHYLDVIMRQLFGDENCRSRIAWKRTGSQNSVRRKHGHIHDSIYVFSKSDVYTWNGDEVREPLSAKEREFFDVVDPDGRQWQPWPLVGAEQGGDESRQPWRGFDPAPQCWRIPELVVQDHEAALGRSLRGRTMLDTLDNLVAAGLVEFPGNGELPLYKLYLDHTIGLPVGDVWTNIWGNRRSTKLRFETQKPEVLLERIVYLLSNPSDVVLDPFLGSGTTAVVAERMGRSWIGIERNPETAELAKRRILDAREISRDTGTSRRRRAKDRFWGGLIPAPTTR